MLKNKYEDNLVDDVKHEVIASLEIYEQTNKKILKSIQQYEVAVLQYEVYMLFFLQSLFLLIL